MRNKYLVLLTAVALVMSFALLAGAQESNQKWRLMVVDESESFEISMRIQGLVGVVKTRPNIEVLTKMADVDHPTENPLKEEKGLGVDAVIIVPHTIETNLINQVWIVTRPFSSLPVEMRAKVENMMSQLKNGIDQAFAGKVTSVGVDDDLIPAYFSSLFVKEGILR